MSASTNRHRSLWHCSGSRSGFGSTLYVSGGYPLVKRKREQPPKRRGSACMLGDSGARKEWPHLGTNSYSKLNVSSHQPVLAFVVQSNQQLACCREKACRSPDPLQPQFTSGLVQRGCFAAARSRQLQRWMCVVSRSAARDVTMARERTLRTAPSPPPLPCCHQIELRRTSQMLRRYRPVAMGQGQCIDVGQAATHCSSHPPSSRCSRQVDPKWKPIPS